MGHSLKVIGNVTIFSRVHTTCYLRLINIQQTLSNSLRPTWSVNRQRRATLAAVRMLL